jgi:hypothetical protein
MKTVIENSTGKVLYTTIVEPQVIDGQTILDDNPKSPFLIPYYNFETKEFYEGATPEEIAEYQQTLVPQSITRRQFKIALAILGKNEQDIIIGINQLPEPTKTIALISYTEAGTFERNNQELIFVGKTFLQMTDAQIDNIFIVGSQY